MTNVIPFQKGARIDITQCEPGLIMLATIGAVGLVDFRNIKVWTQVLPA